MRGRTHAKRFTIVLAMAVLAIGAFAGAALAADSQSTTTLTGGDLSIHSAFTAGTFSCTLDGHAQTLDGSGFSGFAISDARGTGVGWQVAMQATQLTNAASKTFALNSLTAPLFAVAKHDAGSSDVPGTLHAAATIDTGESSVVMVACSAAGQGMGSYDFSADASAWKLAVTADEYAGTYSSTITTTLSTLAL